MTTSAIAPAITSTLPPDVDAAARAAHGRSGTRAAGRAVADAIVESPARRKAPSAAKAKPGAGASASGASASASGKATTTTATTLPGELAFLKDPRLSIQDKVFRFLLYLQDKADRELEAKLKEMAPKTSTTTTGKGQKGWLGEALERVGKLVPGIGIGLDLLQSPEGRAFLKQISGPVLAAAATALGAPQLAPLLMKMGPGIVDGAARAAGATGSTTSTSTSRSEETTNDQRQIIELQHLMEKQRTTIQLLSNVMRVMHETTGAVVGNIR